MTAPIAAHFDPASSVSPDLVQSLAPPVNADSFAILHDCKPNRSGVHSAAPTAALLDTGPSLDAVLATMSVPQRIMLSHSLKLFRSGLLSDFCRFWCRQ